MADATAAQSQSGRGVQREGGGRASAKGAAHCESRPIWLRGNRRMVVTAGRVCGMHSLPPPAGGWHGGPLQPPTGLHTPGKQAGFTRGGRRGCMHSMHMLGTCCARAHSHGVARTQPPYSLPTPRAWGPGRGAHHAAQTTCKQAHAAAQANHAPRAWFVCPTRCSTLPAPHPAAACPTGAPFASASPPLPTTSLLVEPGTKSANRCKRTNHPGQCAQRLVESVTLGVEAVNALPGVEVRRGRMLLPPMRCATAGRGWADRGRGAAWQPQAMPLSRNGCGRVFAICPVRMRHWMHGMGCTRPVGCPLLASRPFPSSGCPRPLANPLDTP